MKHPITASRINEAMQDKHMTAKELSDRSGVSQASLSQYMNGSHAPSNMSAKKISDILGVDPLWLMGFDVNKKESVDRAQKYAELLSRLPEKKQEIIFSLIDEMKEDPHVD